MLDNACRKQNYSNSLRQSFASLWVRFTCQGLHFANSQVNQSLQPPTYLMELFSRALLTLLRVALLAKPLPNDDVHGDSYTKYTNHTHTHTHVHTPSNTARCSTTPRFLMSMVRKAQKLPRVYSHPNASVSIHHTYLCACV